MDGKEKTIYTRPLGHEILPSITRAMVMKIAQNAGLHFAEALLTPAQTAQMDELFIAVTTKDIVPVVEFDGVAIGGGKPGECTRRLIEEFAAMVRAM